MPSERAETSTPGGRPSVRPLLATDLPDLLNLLEWMDARPEREVFAPIARTIDDLKWECRGKTTFGQTGREGELLAYCALSPYRDGLVLEGPLCETADPAPALSAAVEKALEAPERVLYAFCARSNAPVRHALSGVGFEAFGGTTFHTLTRGQHRPKDAPLPDGAVQIAAERLTLDDYQRLYRDSDEAWSARLEWTEDDYRQHFAGENVELICLGVPGANGRPQPVAHCELELDGEEAEIAYIGVAAA
ncbi:MAG TPA: GNAT family N-acetyltransferase, partial [Deinococcales bacterium]|nr:GNAT family N-acetyltransferase [Deinococcales bacterium]